MNEAVRHLRDDLVWSGVDKDRTDEVSLLYANALTRGSREVWHEFYRAVLHALEALATRPEARGRVEARESLLRIIEDDLGSTLFGDAAARLRERLVQLRPELRVIHTSAIA
jgi:hypothetical protein